MEITSAKFVKSSALVSELPDPTLPEIAFLGRSNVGKSTLINMLTGRLQLTKTSSTPGKTRLINHFLINNNTFWVDLPGLGYAKISKKERHKISKMLSDYFGKRTNIKQLFYLVDVSIPPQEIDIDFLAFCYEEAIPLTLLLTKADRPNQSELNKNKNLILNTILEYFPGLPPFFLTAQKNNRGKDKVLKHIENILQN